MHRIISFLTALVLVLGVGVPVFAQSDATTRPEGWHPPSLADVPATGNLNCFDYYTFGSVQADLQSNLAQTVPGATLSFSGNITNSNNYPLLDGKLSVKIFRQDDTTFASGDGNLVVDQFVIAENITLPAKGIHTTSFDWSVPNNAQGGEYYAAFFFTTSDRYNLMGLSFTDDVVGNMAQFSITNPNDTKVATLQKTAVTLNGRDPALAAFPLHFAAGDSVTIKTTLKNPSDQPKSVPLQWKQYAWDAQNEENIRNTKTELVTLAGNETKEVSYTVAKQRESVVYVTASTQDQESKSILNIRFVRDGIEETRINFPSLTKFPLAAGESQILFACAHSTNQPIVPGNTLTLTLTDENGNQIHQYRYEGDISGEMSGFGQEFIPSENYNYINLEAKLERKGVVVERVNMIYDCTKIDQSSCLAKTASENKPNHEFTQLIPIALGVGVLIIIIILLIILGFRHFRREKGTVYTIPDRMK